MATLPDTIVALSSALPAAGAEAQLAVLRLSGPRAAELADGVFKIAPQDKHKKSAAPAVSGPLSLAEARNARRWRRVAGSVLWRTYELPAHAYVMPAPRSFTREDVAELHVPALPWLVDELLDTLVKSGARVAQAGEFTRRAFEHGRISLAQAETVGQLISSGSAEAARAFAQRLMTHADARRQQLKEGLEALLAQVELGLDFAHEDVVVISTDELKRGLERLQTLAAAWLLDTSSEAAELSAHGIPRIVLAGPTNAGKSSLFNALLMQDAAIVSAQRHTTRDAVEGRLALTFDDVVFEALLIDSAGSAAAGEAPHQPVAWDATKQALRGADLALLVLDANVPPELQDGVPALLAEAGAFRDNAALVWTKVDLLKADSAALKCEHGGIAGHIFNTVFAVSALSGAGMDGLRNFLAAQTAALSRRSGEARAAAGAALRSAAQHAAEALDRAAGALKDCSGEDAVAVELREALHACWQAEGIFRRHDAVTEAALDRIFAQFCVGK